MKKLGFGCMRLPMKDGEIDKGEFKRMVDLFLAEGFTYFDTARGYHDLKSEPALRECLTSRYPREAYQLTDKLSGNFFEKEADIRPLFQSQLDACGVEYFDYYLMHSQTAELYDKYVRCNAYQTAAQLKAEGKIRHLGISFHDTAPVLERILTQQPEVEVVQIQFNYADYDSPSIQSRQVYQVCRKFGKPVLVMEPVKGGRLASLTPEARAVLDGLNGGSPASYAIRFAASFEGVMTVLSGMSSYDQLADNTSFMKSFQPLSQEELRAVDQVRSILDAQNLVPCTACRYCEAGCPMRIPIPDLIACLNAKNRYQDWNSGFYYSTHTKAAGKAGDCIRCGACEEICPQHLGVRELMRRISEAFDKE